MSENHDESSFTIERVIQILTQVKNLPRPKDNTILVPRQEGYGSHKARINVFQCVTGMLELSIRRGWLKSNDGYEKFLDKYLKQHPLVRGKLITVEQLDDLDRVVGLALNELKDYQEKIK